MILLILKEMHKTKIFHTPLHKASKNGNVELVNHCIQTIELDLKHQQLFIDRLPSR